MSKGQLSKRKLIKMMLARILLVYFILFVFFFLPAGTLVYWQAWVYMVILFILMMSVLIYLLKNNPELLERRMRMREKVSEQKRIIKFSIIPFILFYLLPGFDKRFGWSNVPDSIVIVADILVFLGYGIIILVFRENTYASRVIEVEKGQSVITSGPYALVRHPMYLGSIIFYVFTPLALGSFWAMIPATSIIPILVARIRNEENVLVRDLKGYKEYMKKRRFRLIPGIW